MSRIVKERIQLNKFLQECPTPFHTIAHSSALLKQQGFTLLHEGSPWKLQAGGKYFVTRGSSSLLAFILPTHEATSSLIVASHTDSPALKLKPNSDKIEEHLALLGVEVYGEPLLSSWLNRDLGVAGRIFSKEGKEKLVRFDKEPVMIAQLAVHLDREVNDKGLILNRQEHLFPIGGSKAYLKDKVGDALSHDLFLFPLEPPSTLSGNLLASYRIDNLLSLFATLSAYLPAKPAKDCIKIAIFWDHEEIGSQSFKGAKSSFLSDILQRITSYETYPIIKANSLLVSLDVAHAAHPNYPNKHDPLHPLFLGKGVVLKHNALGKYATDAASSAKIIALCKKHKIPFQHFAGRNDIPCGSTVGPVASAELGIACVDMGVAILSMHSCREIASLDDLDCLTKCITHAYADCICNAR